MNFRRFLFNILAILGFALFGAKSYGMDRTGQPDQSSKMDSERQRVEPRNSVRFSSDDWAQPVAQPVPYWTPPYASGYSIPRLKPQEPQKHNIAKHEGLTQRELSLSVLLTSLKDQINEYRKIEREYDTASNLKKAEINAKIQKFIDHIKFLYQYVGDKQKNIIKSEVANVLSHNDVDYFAMIFGPFEETYKFWHEYKTGRRPTIEDLKAWPKKLQDFYISKIKNTTENNFKGYAKRSVNVLIDAIIAYNLLDGKLPNVPLLSRILAQYPTINLGIHAAGFLTLAHLINEKGFSLNKLIFTGSYLAGKAINKTTSFIGDLTNNITSKLSNARDYVLG